MEQRHLLSDGHGGRDVLSPHEIARRLADGLGRRPRSREAVAARLGGACVEGLIVPGQRVSDAPPIPAAVLVPLVRRPQGLTVLLTLRTAHLSHHAGQISFPGGRIEDHDADPTGAALRETEEEIGLPPERIDLLGRLDDFMTGTGFQVTPIVGMVTPPFPLSIDPFEVAEVFEVPLDFVLDSANHQLCSRVVGNVERPYYAISFEGRFIWGATAGMLVNLSEVLSEACASS